MERDGESQEQNKLFSRNALIKQVPCTIFKKCLQLCVCFETYFAELTLTTTLLYLRNSALLQQISLGNQANVFIRISYLRENTIF